MRPRNTSIYDRYIGAAPLYKIKKAANICNLIGPLGVLAPPPPLCALWKSENTCARPSAGSAATARPRDLFSVAVPRGRSLAECTGRGLRFLTLACLQRFMYNLSQSSVGQQVVKIEYGRHLADSRSERFFRKDEDSFFDFKELPRGIRDVKDLPARADDLCTAADLMDRI